MIKLKKIMALGLSALMVTSLVGCGGTTNATENKKSDSSKGTEITFWNSFTGADGDMLVKMVDKFNKENKDGIKVKMDISSDFDSQLSTAFAAADILPLSTISPSKVNPGRNGTPHFVHDGIPTACRIKSDPYTLPQFGQ